MWHACLHVHVTCLYHIGQALVAAGNFGRLPPENIWTQKHVANWLLCNSKSDRVNFMVDSLETTKST